MFTKVIPIYQGEIHMMQDNKKRLRAGLVLILACSLTMTACGSNGNGGADNTANTPGAGNESPANTANEPEQTEEPAELTLTDASGTEVTIPADPQHVLASYLEDYLVALDVKPVAQWSVANGTMEYLTDELAGIPEIPFDLPLEVVNSMDPDFIILGDDSQGAEGKKDELAKIAPTFLLGSETVKDWRQTLTKIGEILQREDQAAAVLEAYDAKVDEAKTAIEGAVPGESAAILWLISETIYLVDESVASGAVLYDDLGLTPPNLVTDIPEENRNSWNPISMEALADLDADHIFLINGEGAESETLKTAVWNNLPAVKAGQVYELPAKSSWLYSGPIASGNIVDEAVERLVP